MRILATFRAWLARGVTRHCAHRQNEGVAMPDDVALAHFDQCLPHEERLKYLTIHRNKCVDPRCPWLVWCHCGGWKPIAKAPDWRTAYDWSLKHVAEHEAARCGKCGRLP